MSLNMPSVREHFKYSLIQGHLWSSIIWRFTSKRERCMALKVCILRHTILGVKIASPYEVFIRKPVSCVITLQLFLQLSEKDDLSLYRR